MRSFLAALIATFIIVFSPKSAFADSWIAPSKITYESTNHAFRLTVFPREISSPLDYFDDAVKGNERPGQQLGARSNARGKLERRDGKRWTTVWDKPLVNDVAPVEAVISDDGKFVATLDNWHFMGHDKNVVVTYGSDGSLLKSLQLSDLLPDPYIKALPHSVSSIWWRGDASFSADDKLAINVAVPSDTTPSNLPGKFLILNVDPISGRASPKSGSEWDFAIDEAKRVAALKDTQEKERLAFFTSPLIGPATNDESAWHGYLTEAFLRLASDWEENMPATKVLRSPSAKDYQPSVGWLRDALLETEGPADVVAIASPASPSNLVAVLHDIASKIRPGALKQARIYVAAPLSYRDRIAAILAPTGAQFIYLDPARPIPQRPERLTQFSRSS